MNFKEELIKLRNKLLNINLEQSNNVDKINLNEQILVNQGYEFKISKNENCNDFIIANDVSLQHGNNYFYEVLEIEILKPTEVSEMINNDFDLTLYTCTSDSKNRVTVRCNRVEI